MRWFLRIVCAIYAVFDRRVFNALTEIARNHGKRATFAALHVFLLVGHYIFGMCAVEEYSCGPNAAPSAGVLCVTHMGMFVVYYALFTLSLFVGTGDRTAVPR